MTNDAMVERRLPPDASAELVVAARDVWVSFPTRVGLFRRRPLHAVRGVDLDVRAGETVGLVGESGSGKSTLSRAILGLVPVAEGSIEVMGTETVGMSERQRRPLRRDAQMVFQDPYSSLDPSSMVGQIVGEPLRVHTDMSARERREAVAEALDLVGLPRTALTRYSYEFSGGQRQRIAIARAIVTRPRLLVLDEAVSALDVSTQNQVLELLSGLRRDLGLSMLFVSHDLAVVRWISDWVAVMYLGEIVEVGPSDRVHHRPAHPYSELLQAAELTPDPERERRRVHVATDGELPDPIDPPSGCSFRTRCPHAFDRCAVEAPARRPVDTGGWAACHLLDG